MEIPLTYSVYRGDEMTSALWAEVSSLFSSEYGYYSESSPIRPGERIRMGVKRYERSYAVFSVFNWDYLDLIKIGKIDYAVSQARRYSSSQKKSRVVP